MEDCLILKSGLPVEPVKKGPVSDFTFCLSRRPNGNGPNGLNGQTGSTEHSEEE